ncbi:cytochrome P450 [Actinoplanes lutulentus]|uniref:cytochrome P450 n=1 Tax=Actinoplanes lutulentus TaxID=1287878 RepID=UPI0015EC0C48|nr:cytochrome P450 [Actinoplanes lutulentus]MBB2940580.1 cytochrome P450 [Actinoplanes lutulentus]
MLAQNLITFADLPGPPSLPLVGNKLALARAGGPNHAFQQWCDRYGPTYRLRLPAPTVVTADPLLVDQVLKQRPETFRRSPRVTSTLQGLGIHGVFTAEASEWHRLRRVATRSLNAAHLNTYFDTMTRTAERVRRRWHDAAATGERIDVLDEMMRYTLDVTVGLAVGHDLNAVENRDGGLPARLPELFPEIGRRLYAPLPYWKFLNGARRRRLAETMSELDALVAEQFQVAKARVAGGASPANFLEALAAPVDGEPELSHAELVGNVLTMLLAGEDTTSATAAWTLHYLANDPQMLRRVRAEAQTVLGDRPFAGDPGTLRKLELAGAAVREAVRMRPVAPYLAMQALHDVVLTGQDGPLRIDSGTIVFVLLSRGARHDTDRFGEPDEFRPQRWLGADPEATGGTAPFLPFGGGPRFCPGRNLAIVETTLVTSMLCREFDLEPDTTTGSVGERTAFSVFPTNLFVRARLPQPANPE